MISDQKMDDALRANQQCKRPKGTTDKYLAIDVRGWQRDGVLSPGTSFNTTWPANGASIGVRAADTKVILIYRHKNANAEWVDLEYSVRIDRSSCNYGGTRAWFACPVNDCGRRVAILYLGPE